MSTRYRTIGYRQMRPADVPACVRIVADHPVIGARYGDAIADLPAVWHHILDQDSAGLVVFYETTGSRTTIWGVGVSVFVSDAFLTEVRTPPSFWIGPELTRRIKRGGSPLLSDKQLRDANSSGGLNLVVWDGCIRPEDANRPEIYNALMEAFVQEHRGFRLNEVIAAQADNAATLANLLHSGGLLWDATSRSWKESSEELAVEIVSKPHVVGVARGRGNRLCGSWVSTLFDYLSPQFGFTLSQQRLLRAAFGEGTDEELARELNMSVSAVKKTWKLIYQRISERLPQLVYDLSDDTGREPGRGRQKKWRIMSYLREHPEELRPVSRELLQRS